MAYVNMTVDGKTRKTSKLNLIGADGATKTALLQAVLEASDTADGSGGLPVDYIIATCGETKTGVDAAYGDWALSVDNVFGYKPTRIVAYNLTVIKNKTLGIWTWSGSTTSNSLDCIYSSDGKGSGGSEAISVHGESRYVNITDDKINLGLFSKYYKSVTEGDQIMIIAFGV